mgnify:CR=1 FL=1
MHVSNLFHIFLHLIAIERLGEIGQLVAGLDIKTMAEQWKGYARLVFQYVDHLKPRLDIASTLQFFATDISKGLEKVVKLVSIVSSDTGLVNLNENV